jgi:hypothetical protein
MSGRATIAAVDMHGSNSCGYDAKNGVGTYLVLIRCPHILKDVLGSGVVNASLLGQDFLHNGVNFASHIRCVTTDIEIGFLLQEFVNLLGPLLQLLLYVDFLGALS